MRLLAAFLCAITVIEPADAPARNILQYGTYLGGSHKDSVRAIAVDADGNAYAGGETLSPDFPSTPGAFLTNSGVSADDYAGFVAKIAPDGKRLLYSTFLRGSPGKGLIRTFVNALAVDSQGNAYAAGSTCSPDFPVTPGAFQQHAPGPGPNLLEPCDAFVAKLDATGSHLLYATYLGGAGSDSATSIWVDTQANAYVAGYTSSPDFPVTEDALQRSHGGEKDGFLVKLDAQGRRLLYGTFLGGTEMDEVAAMAGDSRGNVYVAGATRSSEFPPLTRRRRASPDFDAFFLRITPGARPPAAASLRIGGSGDDAATAIALGPDSDVYVAGWTASGDFPCTTNALERRFRGGKTDAFWVRVAGAAGQRPRVAYSSLLGGSDDDAAAAIAIDGRGSIFIGGRTASSDFPATPSAFHRRLERNDDGFLAQIRSDGNRIEFGTYIGGGRDRQAWRNAGVNGLAIGPTGDVYVAGATIAAALPVSPGSIQNRPRGNTEGFVLRLRLQGSGHAGN